MTGFGQNCHYHLDVEYFSKVYSLFYHTKRRKSVNPAFAKERVKKKNKQRFYNSTACNNEKLLQHRMCVNHGEQKLSSEVAMKTQAKWLDMKALRKRYSVCV